MKTKAGIIERFLASKEAVEGKFDALGWEKQRIKGGVNFYLLSTYGIMEDMEMEVTLEDGVLGVQLFIPSVRADLLPQADALLDAFDRLHSPLSILKIEDGYLVGGGCEFTPDLAEFVPLWRAYGDPDVYEILLTLCSLTDAPDESAFEPMPDDPFEESI